MRIVLLGATSRTGRWLLAEAVLLGLAERPAPTRTAVNVTGA